MRPSPSVLLLTCLVACGAKPPPDPVATAPTTSAPVAASAPPVASAAPPAPEPFPVACASTSNGVCVMSDAFVERICKTQSADVALALLRKGTPWTRGYLTRDTEAWNASGGGSSRSKMLFDEEVVVLRKRAASAMMVGQGGSYDAVRWDGSCVTLAEEEMTLKKPPRQRSSPISWRYLDTATRDALAADPKVGPAQDKRRKECKGATSGEVSTTCIKADTALSEAIVEFVRQGGELPAPKLPLEHVGERFERGAREERGPPAPRLAAEGEAPGWNPTVPRDPSLLGAVSPRDGPLRCFSLRDGFSGSVSLRDGSPA